MDNTIIGMTVLRAADDHIVLSRDTTCTLEACKADKSEPHAELVTLKVKGGSIQLATIHSPMSLADIPTAMMEAYLKQMR